ncbi:MAG: NYN domain-containing protein [Gemmatales bacterium]|nr:NYN domain-containing protein [Gemmatales bacterium]MCS7158960.1 NYN domain-containing protein [Gemmatales bacterium]MDW8174160.1 NYN domain-containing protein [Gemmatales bacterium]MDW8223669.1 NYN domain-containing protein [Gemmatales bacterium]
MAEASAHSLALFLDFENFALGLTDPHERFDINRVLRRMVEKGKVVVRKAYADWSYYPSYTATLHEAGFELIDIPRRSQSGKNSADIRLCVDAMDLAYSKEHINTFVILSGDSDFTPLVSKLKELGKHVIGVGMASATSDLLRDNCDEFIYYEDLEHIVSSFEIDPRLPENKRKAFQLLMDALTALRRENKEVLWSSLIKDTMKRIKPSFNETYHGYYSFTELLEDAEHHGLLELAKERRSGTIVVTRFGEEMREEPSAGERERGRRRVSPIRRRLVRTAPIRSAAESGPREATSATTAVGEIPVTAPGEGTAPADLVTPAESPIPTTTVATPGAPPRIVFTIGEASRRTEAAYAPSAARPTTAYGAVEPLPEPAPQESAVSPAPPLPPSTPASIGEAAESPPPAIAATVPAPEAIASPESAQPSASPPRPAAPPPSPTTSVSRRDARPFGFGIFDAPPASEG